MPTLDAAACAALMDELTKITAQAAETILATKADVRIKADGSPVTAADEADLLDWDAEKYRQSLDTRPS